MAKKMPSASQLVGKTIVAYTPGTYIAGTGCQQVTMHQPELVLDDGSRLRFMTEEDPDGRDYGTFIVRVMPPK